MRLVFGDLGSMLPTLLEPGPETADFRTNGFKGIVVDHTPRTE